MRRTRVLQVIPSLEVAGAETMVTNLCLALDRSRFEVSVLVFFDSPGSPLAEALQAAQVPVYVLGKRLGFDPTTFWKLERVLRRVAPDVVHTHLGAIRYALPSLAMRPRMVRVHTLHILAEDETKLPIVNRVGFSLGIEPVAIAKAVAESVERVYGRRQPVIIPNGIPVSAYEHAAIPREAWRRAEGFSLSDFLFVNVGRLMEQKNQNLLIRAFAVAVADMPCAKLLIAGEGPLREKLCETARNAGVEFSVRFLGLRSDVPSLLLASDAFVLSSDSEGNPLCIMEAMAAGLPVVSTEVGGVPELIEEGRSGWLVKPGDLAGMAAAMRVIAKNRDLATTVGRSALIRARARFDVAMMARAYERLYAHKLAGPGSRSDAA